MWVNLFQNILDFSAISNKTDVQRAIDGKNFGKLNHILSFPPLSPHLSQISIGNIGEIKKIRLSHDNAGDSPSWYVGEVLMIDIHSEEQLVFRFDRWLSRDHDHGEICREVPAVRAGKAVPTSERLRAWAREK